MGDKVGRMGMGNRVKRVLRKKGGKYLTKVSKEKVLAHYQNRTGDLIIDLDILILELEY